MTYTDRPPAATSHHKTVKVRSTTAEHTCMNTEQSRLEDFDKSWNRAEKLSAEFSKPYWLYRSSEHATTYTVSVIEPTADQIADGTNVVKFVNGEPV